MMGLIYLLRNLIRDAVKMASQKIVAANAVANAFGALLNTPEKKKTDEEEEGDKSPERATMAHRWSTNNILFYGSK